MICAGFPVERYPLAELRAIWWGLEPAHRHAGRPELAGRRDGRRARPRHRHRGSDRAGLHVERRAAVPLRHGRRHRAVLPPPSQAGRRRPASPARWRCTTRSPAAGPTCSNVLYAAVHGELAVQRTARRAAVVRHAGLRPGERRRRLRLRRLEHPVGGEELRRAAAHPGAGRSGGVRGAGRRRAPVLGRAHARAGLDAVRPQPHGIPHAHRVRGLRRPDAQAPPAAGVAQPAQQPCAAGELRPLLRRRQRPAPSAAGTRAATAKRASRPT